MNKVEMIEIVCPGCGKEKHCFQIPSNAGKYRLRCQSDRDKQIIIDVQADGTIKAVDKETFIS